MNKKKKVLVFYDKILFFVPVHRDSYLGVVEYSEAKSLPHNASQNDKGELLLQILEQSGKNVVYSNSDDFEIKFQPFLLLAQAKSWNSFARRVLNFSVLDEEDNLVFTPCVYNRGSFSGTDHNLVIPTSSSPDDIGKAIDKVLTFCIGKGGKRLNDFMGKQ